MASAAAAAFAPRPLASASFVSASALAVTSAARRGTGVAPALTMGLRSAASAGVVLKDFSSTGISFFSSVRIPSSLIAGSTLAALFALKEYLLDADNRSRGEQVCIKLYHLCMLLSFTLATTAVLISTISLTSILHGRYDVMAETGYLFLKREMEYEFVVTRWSFLVSMLSFLCGVTCRALLEFGLVRREKRSGLLAVLLSLAALTAHLISLINGSLYCWPNLIAMTVHVFKLTLRRGIENKPLELFSLASATGAAFFLFKSLFLERGRHHKD